MTTLAFIRDCPLVKNSVIPAQAGIQLLEYYPAKRDNMAVLPALRNVLLLDSRLRGNDVAAGLFRFIHA